MLTYCMIYNSKFIAIFNSELEKDYLMRARDMRERERERTTCRKEGKRERVGEKEREMNLTYFSFFFFKQPFILFFVF